MLVQRQRRRHEGVEIATVLAKLRGLRNVFTPQAERNQRTLLREVEGLRLRKWAQLSQLHEDLLFVTAFPASLATRKSARALLRKIFRRMQDLPRAERARADDSGIAGSITRHVYPFPLARVLATTENADVDWGNVEDEAGTDSSPVCA